MTTEAIEPSDQKFDLVAVFRAAAPEARDRKFWITLAIALLAHLAILISIVRAPPRQMGDPNSVPEAVSVSFVTEAELRDATTGSDGGAAVPSQQPTPPPQPQAQPQPPTPPQPPEPQVQPTPAPQAAQPAPQPKSEAEKSEPPPKAEETEKAEELKAPDTPTLRDSLPAEAATEKKAKETERLKSETETKEVKDAKAAEAKETQETTETKEAKEAQEELAELLKLPDPATIQQPAPKQQAKRPSQPPQKQAMRQPDMTMPRDAMQTPSYDGRSAGVQRPAGITRSGANDDFARGVIRALRQTMPQMNVLGRVTVRILINMSGNIQSVEVLSRSENSDLNRAVVFSTKQASFPFPPNGATELDRTFTITYIYH